MLLAGVDESGRGPLAGPVVAAAVILPSQFNHQLDDSKKIPEDKRIILCEHIISQALAVGISFVSPQIIDQLNIRRATLIAMRNAIEMLEVEPEYIMVDGVDTIPGVQIPQEAVIRGDSKILSISAASIIAKVTRDNFMKSIHPFFAQYEFSSHKGYATKHHYALLKRFGACAFHRISFKGVA